MKEIIVVGAARSGTKIMRDTLAVALGCGSVPYDIGYVWHAHVSCEHDAFRPNDLDEAGVRYVRRFIQRYGLGHRAVVEKTVGNALRIPAVHRVFPDACYVHLIRDGVDVVKSAAREWEAPTDYRYVARKLRHFPVSQLPTYGVDYLRRALRRGRTDVDLPVWGPRYPGVDADARIDPLGVVCAKQWAACVSSADEGFREVDAQVIEVRYEEFVRHPAKTMYQVAEAVGIDPDPPGLRQVVSAVITPTSNRARGCLDESLTHQLSEVMDVDLKRLGYLELGAR